MSDNDGTNAESGKFVRHDREDSKQERRARLWVAAAKVAVPVAWITVEVLRWFGPH